MLFFIQGSWGKQKRLLLACIASSIYRGSCTNNLTFVSIKRQFIRLQFRTEKLTICILHNKNRKRLISLDDYQKFEGKLIFFIKQHWHHNTAQDNLQFLIVEWLVEMKG